MKTSSPDPHSWAERAARIFHEYTVRGACPVILGYPQNPDIVHLRRQIRDSLVVGSVADCHTLPGYRAYVVISHPLYREEIVRRILRTIHNLHPHSFVIHKEPFSTEKFSHKAA